MKKLLKRRKKSEQAAPSRITNETVAEHRERILAGGRKFKYPHQYLKHKLVINAIILTTVIVLFLVFLAWWQLYKVQSTSDFMYRITRVVPVPVASVDGSSARYSDYLMRYRSQELWLRNNGQLGLNPNDERQQLNFFKRSVLDGLERDVFAEKIAKEKNINVEQAEVDAVIEESRTTATGKISEEVYNASTLDTLGYTPDEYRYIIQQALLRQKVAYAIDTPAQKTRDSVVALLEKNKSDSPLQQIAISLKKKGHDLEYGESGLVPKNNRDGGLTQAALRLKPGKVSAPIESTSGDGYYFVQRLSGDNDRVSYSSLRIPLTVFEDQFKKLKQQGKVHEYIAVKSSSTKK